MDVYPAAAVPRGTPTSFRALASSSALPIGHMRVAVTWSVISRQGNSSITHEAANSFNLQTGPAPVRASLRDAVAAAPSAPSSLTRLIATADMDVGELSVMPPEAILYTSVAPRAEAWAKKHKFLAGLVGKPARFLMGRSSLGSARDLRAFLGDPKKVDAYMNSALVRVTLNSPAVAKVLLGNPAVIRAFLATPALRDPQAVRALLSSPMLRKMLDCPAIQDALADPVVMRRMIADRATVVWIAAHPAALMAIADAVPALGDAFAAKTGR